MASERLGLERLLDLEDDPLLAELVCPSTEVLAWPAIREDVLRLVLGDRLFGGASLVDLTRQPNVRPIVANGVRAAALNTTRGRRGSEVLLVGTGAGLVPRSGRMFNRLTDYFAGVLGERAWTAELLVDDTWPTAPRSNRRLTFLADQRLASAMLTRVVVRPGHRAMAADLIDVLSNRGRDLIGWELSGDRRASLVRVAARRLAAYPIQARFATRLLGSVRPRVVLVEEAAYGQHAVFNATAARSGVEVAEFQHGLVTRGHHAYNVAPTIGASAAYRLTQPATFLAYGSWWNEQFNAPIARRVVVGNPHRTETLRGWTAEASRPNILVIGNGFETEAYLAFCRELATRVPSTFNVLFRPHPIERSRVPDRVGPNVAIDREPDLYRSLASSGAVVAEASTVLFEAVGLVPQIFVWNTQKSRFYLGHHHFDQFDDASDLAAKLPFAGSGVLRGDLADGVWAGDWANRFRAFVDGPHERA